MWLALIAACVVLGSLSGTRTLSNSASGVGEAAHAQARLASAGLADPATENVLVRSSSATRTAAVVATLSRRARSLRTVRAVRTPRQTAGLSRAGGRTALVVVMLRGAASDADAQVAPLEGLVSSVAHQSPGVSVQESGGASIDRAMNQIVDDGLHRAELIALPITLLILVLAFGAVVAAFVPLLLGMTSVGAALGALGLVSHVAPNGSSTAPVVVLIGLAVGVDYSLFYIRRERAERRAGAGPDAALDATASTVGRAIVVAGMTVVIGLAGLLFTGFGVFTSMALGAIVVVVIAVIGSLTVLPAVLALLGERVDRGRLSGRRDHRSDHARRSRLTLWSRFAGVVTGHPRLALALALIVLVGLALPVLGMRTAAPGDRDASAQTPVLVAEHAVEQAFPGSSQIGQLVVTGRGLGTPTARAELMALGRAGRRITGGRGEVSVRVSRTGETALVSIPVPSGDLSVAKRNVQTLRSRLGPATARLIPGARAQLTGDDAENVDFTQRLSDDHSAGHRVRAGPGIRAPGRHVPIAVAGTVGDGPEPPVGRRGLRGAGHRLPAHLGPVAARLHVRRRGRQLAAPVRLRGAVRAVDGLHGAHAGARRGGSPGRGKRSGSGG